MTQPDDTSRDTIRLLSVRGAIVAGATGGLLFGLNFAFQALVVAFQMTGATGFVTGFTVPLFLALAAQINREWGTATLAWTLYSALAVPTLLMGAPGLYKVLLGVVAGAAYDLGFCGIFRGRKPGLYVGLILYVIVLNIGFYVVYVLGLMPTFAGGDIIKVLVVVTSVFVVEGTISTWAATWLYERRVRVLMEGG